MRRPNPTLSMVPQLLNDRNYRSQFTAGLNDPEGLDQVGLDPDLTDGEIRSVAAALAGVADPRQARGVRHHGFGLLMGVLSALLAGARTTVQIAEHVADLSPAQRARLGLLWPCPPSLSTLRRYLLVLDQGVLQQA